jgi:plastocyanin
MAAELRSPDTATTPAPCRRRAGVLLWACCLLLALAAGTACDRVPGLGGGEDQGPRVLELAHDTIRLEQGVRLHEVVLSRARAGIFEPARLQVRQGDVVRFTAEDGAGHAVVFTGEALAPGARQFLESTGQMRSPPFVAAGSGWVITLEGAPAGEYPFLCTTHDARGSLTVVPRDP